jgi:hypothetical protein
VITPGIHQVGGDRLIIFGGWHTENLKSIFILKEAQSTFTLNTSKHSMEKGDIFLVNGVVRNDGTDRLVAGQNFVHNLAEKSAAIKIVRPVEKV